MKKIPKSGQIWDFWNFRSREYRMLRRWRVEKVVCSARKWLCPIDMAIGL